MPTPVTDTTPTPRRLAYGDIEVTPDPGRAAHMVNQVKECTIPEFTLYLLSYLIYILLSTNYSNELNVYIRIFLWFSNILIQMVLSQNTQRVGIPKTKDFRRMSNKAQNIILIIKNSDNHSRIVCHVSKICRYIMREEPVTTWPTILYYIVYRIWSKFILLF